MDSQSLFQDYVARQDTATSIPSRSDVAVPVAWTATSTVLLRSHVGRNPFPNGQEEPFARR